MSSKRDLDDLALARMVETGESLSTARETLLTYLDEAQRFREKTIQTFFKDGRLIFIPSKRRARIVVLIELLRMFEPDIDYPEKEVNQILGNLHSDFAYLRRELIDYGFMTREAGIYRKI